MHPQIRSHKHTHTRALTHPLTHTCTHEHTHTRAHTHTHTHTHTQHVYDTHAHIRWETTHADMVAEGLKKNDIKACVAQVTPVTLVPD